MSFIRMIWALAPSIRSRRSRGTPESNAPSVSPSISEPLPNTLAGLPTELILDISDFLLPDDLTCFSLCNHRLHAVLHRQVPRPPSPANREDNLPILLRLERDLPKCYFICRVCSVFHKYDGSDNYGLDSSVLDRKHACILPCLRRCQDTSQLTMKVYEAYPLHGYTIFFFQLHLAMRRYHYGLEAGISTDSLFYTEVERLSEWSIFPGDLSLFSAEALICPEPLGLYVRMQDILCVRPGQLDLLAPVPSQEYKIDTSGVFLPCRHMPRDAYDIILGDLVDIYRKGQKASTPVETYTCGQCGIDSQFQMGELDSNIALIVTRWVYLGNGESFDDNYWNVQSDKGSLSFGAMTLQPSEMIASARACFENATPRSLDVLQACNISYLQNQRFEKLMHRHRYLDRWRLPSPKPGTKVT